MSLEVQREIKIFLKFIDASYLKKDINSIKEVLELPLDSFKFLGRNEVKVMKEVLNVSTIRETSRLDKNNPFRELYSNPKLSSEKKSSLKEKITLLRKTNPALEFNIKKAITISSLLVEIEKEPQSTQAKKQKVLIAGLDNAGKTAIVSKLGDKLGIADLASLKPTKGVNRKKIRTENLELIIWDLGGQRKYREANLKDPDIYFMDIDLLVYVIDVQDSEKFDETLQYFEEVLKILIMLEENPYILIFIHKYDPEIKTNPEILLNIEFLKENLSEVLNKEGRNFNHEVYCTSIYSLITIEPSFSKFIREVLNVNYSLSDPLARKIDGLGKILEQTINMVIRLSESLSNQLEVLEHRLKAIESGAISSLAIKEMPLEIEPPKIFEEKREENVRAQVLNELKDLFEKKRKLNL
ncbi:MAG: ADP-ribosylation factor-like protein [Promethearchaeota archaeon]